MKDFDQELAREERAKRERTFRIAGREMTYRSGLRPEVLNSWTAIERDEADRIGVKVFDDAILQMLEPDSTEAWREIRADETNPLVFSDIKAIFEYLIEETAARPTEAPSPSTDTRERSGTISKDVASLREATG